MSKDIKHVILLDDESSVVFALTLVLRALGFQVAEFTSPDAALSHATSGEEPVDLFLSDLKMPAMSGHEVLIALREKCPTLPFVLMSGHATDEDVEKSYRLGANGYLPKPFTPEDLVSLFKSISNELA